jgi:uncharacterized protein (TIGR02391 family)
LTITPPPIDPTVIRAVARQLTEGAAGLTNPEIDEAFSASSIPVPPKATKRLRVSETLIERQQQSMIATSIVRFLEAALNPARYTTDRQRFFLLRDAINEPLALAGLHVDDAGRVATGPVATTLDEIAKLRGRLRSQLLSRGAHPEVLRYCEREVIEQNPFHAMQEAVKGVMERLRRHTGLPGDGADLIQVCFSGNPARIQINPQVTVSEQSEQKGFMNLLIGLHGHFRNPTAHATRLTWTVGEQDFLDLCSTLSYVHRRLDHAGVAPTV